MRSMPLLLPPLLLPLLSLLACGDKDGGDPTDTGGDGGTTSEDGGTADGGTGDGGTGDGGTGDGGTSDGGTEAVLSLVAGGLAEVWPPTLDVEVGGTVEATFLATAAWSDGATASLEEAAAGATFTVVLADGSEVEAALSRIDDDRLVLVFDLPEKLSSDGGTRTLAEVQLDGVPWATAAIGLYGPAEDVVGRFVGDPSGRLSSIGVTGGDFQMCDSAVFGLDDGSTIQILTLGVDGDEVVASTCEALPGEEGEWSCEDSSLRVELEDGESLYCGKTDHFLTDDGEIGVTGVLETSTGRLLQTSCWRSSGGSWTGTSCIEGLAAAGSFGVVLGINTTKEDRGEPLAGMLGILAGPRDSWTGTWRDSEGRTWEWSSLGSISASEIGAGQAWAGLFTDHDLSDDPDGSATTWAWALDASAAESGGDLVVDTLAWSAAAGAFARARAATIEHPGFVPEAVAAVGEDLDGDGVAELVIEAWGEGRWAAWVLPDATDKTSTRGARALASRLADSGGFGAAVSISGDGSWAVVGSSMVLGGTGDASSLHSVKGAFFGRELGADQPPAEVRWIDESWPVADLFSAESSPVEAEGSDLVGTGPLLSVAPSSGDRGLCRFGKCFALPGFDGARRVFVGGGDGSSAATLALGEVAFVSEEPGAGLVLARANPRAARPVLAVRTDAGDQVLELSAEGITPTGGVDAEPYFPDGWVLPLAAVPDSSPEGLAVLAFENREETVKVGRDTPTTTVIRADVRVRYQGAMGGGQLPIDTTVDGSTVPVVLSERVSDEGGVLLGWRDGSGQAWLGVLDLDGAAALGEDGGTLPFLDGPVAVGEPLSDPDGVLGLSALVPGMVGVPLAPASDAPYLLADELELRLLDWEEPLEGSLDAGSGGYGPVVMLVGADRGLVREIYLPAVEALADMLPVSLTDAVSPAEDVTVPRIAASLLPDAPPVVVSVSADGQTTLRLVDATEPRAATWNFHVWTETWTRRAPMSAGDLDGDGLADLVLGRGATAEVVRSAGDGTALSVEALEAADLLNFGGLLSGERGRECPLDPDGGAAATVGLPRIGAD